MENYYETLQVLIFSELLGILNEIKYIIISDVTSEINGGMYCIMDVLYFYNCHNVLQINYLIIPP